MQDGFIKVAAASPRLRVGDPAYNTDQILDWVRRATGEGVRVLVFPQLCITGYTCGDLFFQKTLLDGAIAGLRRLCAQTEALDMIIAVGLPLQLGNSLYNCAALLHQGRVLGLVPKYRPEDDCGLTESRYFAVPQGGTDTVEALDGAFFSPEMTLGCADFPALRIGVELGGNIGLTAPPSAALCARGATLILNPAAGPETMAAPAARREQIRAAAGRLLCGYVSAGAGMGESTTDHVYSGHCLIAEGGSLIAEAKPFTGDWAVSEVDVEALSFQRRRDPDYPNLEQPLELPFGMERTATSLSRVFEATPFVPAGVHGRAARCEHILNIQAWGLKKRMEHIGSRHAVIGVSGGLDSTLALLAVKRAYERMDLPPEDIRAYTMPCFGTSSRTRSNAGDLCAALGIPLETIDITRAVRQHFADIGQDESRYDAAFENAQARERTQVLMDIANRVGGLVVGTGDLSELALGWATYNGDQMSMYGVNAAIPKTLIRDVVGYLAEAAENEALTTVLNDILDTPVSPELVPGAGEDIGQKTEDLVGDYRLHDFFLFHSLTRGCGPKKLYRMACRAFEGSFDPATVLKWLTVFCRRFLTQQYKRSSMPDGPGVSGVSLSPRGGLSLPSDAALSLWTAELEQLTTGEHL